MSVNSLTRLGKNKMLHPWGFAASSDTAPHRLTWRTLGVLKTEIGLKQKWCIHRDSNPKPADP